MTPRTAQLAKDRFFVYLNQNPRSVKLFCSRELSPTGVRKRLIEGSDPVVPMARRVMDALIASGRASGTGATVATIAAAVPQVAQALGIEATFLPRTPCYSPRVLVTVR